MVDFTVKLELDKSTKNTYVYTTADPAAPIKTLYVTKQELGNSAPTSLKVTVSSC